MLLIYVGLRAISKRTGYTVWTVQRMASQLGLPLMGHPKTKLRGRRLIWCLDEEMYLRWLMAQSRLDLQGYKRSRATKLTQTGADPKLRSPWNPHWNTVVAAEPQAETVAVPAKEDKVT